MGDWSTNSDDLMPVMGDIVCLAANDSDAKSMKHDACIYLGRNRYNDHVVMRRGKLYSYRHHLDQDYVITLAQD